ncbi:MAG: hypothetical protein M3R27_08890 [Bacteroidota bacterium]|nr:hypothetical protein [Bacteroidota bacterium]
MSEVLAVKGKYKKKFTAEQWNLLGDDKNGWTVAATSHQVVVNKTFKTPPSPGTKATAQVVDNKAEAKAEDEIVKNLVVSPEITEFVKANISRSQIKDLFDAKDVKYKNSLNLDGLIEILAKTYSNNLDDIKAEFKFEDLNNL